MIGQMLEQLINARGQAKIAVLKKYNNASTREVLEYTYNTDYVYHIRPNPVSPLNCFSRDTPLTGDEILLLKMLSQRKISGNEAREAVNDVARRHGPLIKLILSHDLQCGVAATSINKAIPGLIPQFKVQLAKEVPLSAVRFPCLAQLKYDGVRIVTTIKDNVVRFRTRNGKEVKMPALAAVLRAKCNNMMIDGELIIRGGGMVDRTSISGMVNSAMHGGIIMENLIEYVVFDHMPIADFERAKCATIYSNRYKCLERIVTGLKSRRIVLAEHTLVASPAEVNAHVRSVYDSGQEGLILKSATHLYTFKRSKDWVKIKEIKTADLSVLGATEGTGKYEGMIGALDCIGTVEGKQVIVSVGSGLSDEQRDREMDFFDNITIEVKYNSLIQDSKTGQWSLFLPRFSHIRYDK